ncbi:cobalt-precorrin-6A reductase [Cognatiyoonia sp. IB215182]|uniref:cobalt-precorrin-6A reductase n=1 Tax=Cognatiyoonia sp. IB215182 TaxID=3097353 RepID=UPI002A0EB2AD|nr:cobalt-precorrin-6A reductase [Cognatiyoonia sp. IB215182]MDX8353448.1 cobalt-precorrin-6A reductase [Cognatiyoonia sp. IB215182]
MTILLLAGTGDARRLAERLAGRDVIASIAGATREPAPLPVQTRTGGFGGADAFRAYLAKAGISAVVDATHPYAHRITRRTAAICKSLDMPYMQLLRPGWTPEPGDNWTEIAAEEDAAAHIPLGATVFLGTGRQSLERFANLAGRFVICRQIDPPEGPFPLQDGMFLIGRPPFSVEDEIALFKARNVDWLVVKNAGGAASRTKLTAANHLQIPVLMLTRPPQGDWPCVATIDEAMAWVDAL